MSDEEIEQLSKGDKESLKEVLAFWTWLRGLNKGLKWLVFVGVPFAVAFWALLKWINPKP